MIRKSKKWFLFLSIISLSGCFINEDKDIVFKNDTLIPVGEEFNSCTLVDQVEGKKVNRFDYDGNRILVGENAVSCPLVDTSIIGKKELKFEYIGNKYFINIEVIDDKKPVIAADGSEIRIKEKDDLESFMKHIKVDDHDKNLVINVQGIQFGKVGNYDAKIQALDSAGNESEKKVRVIVEKTRLDVNGSDSEKGVHENSGHPLSDDKDHFKILNPQNPVKTPHNDKTNNQKVDSSIYNKKFLFSEGYDYDSCHDAALSYAKQILSQGKANGYSCEPIKNGKEYIGYDVTFK